MKKRVGILLSSFIMMCYIGVAPVIASIAGEFSNVSQSLVQMLITLPSLVSLVTTLIAGKLASVVKKRTIILCSIMCYIVAGLIPNFFNGNIWILLLCSGVMGIGCGAMITTTAGIICDYFDGSDRSMMMGFQGAAIAIGGAVFTLIGGFLSEFGWRTVYLQYLLLIPCAIIIFFTLPEGKLEKAEENTVRAKIPGFVWFVCIVGLLYNLFQNVYNTNASLLIQESALGTDKTSSIATVINTMAGFIAGVTLSIIMGKLRRHTIVFVFTLCSVGLLVTYFGSGTLAIILLGGFCIGYAYSIFVPASTVIVSERVSMEQRSMSIGLISAANSIGAALSPVVLTTAAEVINDTVKVRYLLSAIGMIIMIVVAIFGFSRDKEHDKA